MGIRAQHGIADQFGMLGDEKRPTQWKAVPAMRARNHFVGGRCKREFFRRLAGGDLLGGAIRIRGKRIVVNSHRKTVGIPDNPIRRLPRLSHPNQDVLRKIMLIDNIIKLEPAVRPSQFIAYLDINAFFFQLLFVRIRLRLSLAKKHCASPLTSRLQLR
ncbi:hypothetical protein SDC9_196534 [bioreactor metagenome]|uniref:Uncharacterized protein n=1 Tax=bioreactor metagenome TaxID=1076179 RepID=A0A645IC39_9ZZZZ